MARKELLYSEPKHPYTKGLLACRPRLESPYRILPTVDEFMEYWIVDDGSIEIDEIERADAERQGLFEELLADEEGHIDFIETQLDLYDSIGAERYGLLNASPANEAEDSPGQGWAARPSASCSAMLITSCTARERPSA